MPFVLSLVSTLSHSQCLNLYQNQPRLVYMVQGCSEDELVKHALKALSGCVTGDKELDAQGATLAIVGKVSAARRRTGFAHG